MSEAGSKIRKSTKAIIARIISDVLNPLILPVLVFGFAGFAFHATTQHIAKVMGVTALLFLFVPITAAVIIKKLKNTDSLDFHDQKGRTGLYLISILSVGMGGLIFFKEVYIGMYHTLLLTYVLNLSLAFLMNFKWKVSVHMGSAVTALVLLIWMGYASQTNEGPLIAAIILAGLLPLLAWSRLHLKVHTYIEIILGVLIGLASTTIILFSIA